jgi:hypothetical protein
VQLVLILAIQGPPQRYAHPLPPVNLNQQFNSPAIQQPQPVLRLSRLPYSTTDTSRRAPQHYVPWQWHRPTAPTVPTHSNHPIWLATETIPFHRLETTSSFGVRRQCQHNGRLQEKHNDSRLLHTHRLHHRYIRNRCIHKRCIHKRCIHKRCIHKRCIHKRCGRRMLACRIWYDGEERFQISSQQTQRRARVVSIEFRVSFRGYQHRLTLLSMLLARPFATSIHRRVAVRLPILFRYRLPQTFPASKRINGRELVLLKLHRLLLRQETISVGIWRRHYPPIHWTQIRGASLQICNIYLEQDDELRICLLDNLALFSRPRCLANIHCHKQQRRNRRRHLASSLQ